MTFRSLIRAASPWRDGYRCDVCGRAAVRFFELPRDCRRVGAKERRVPAPWVRYLWIAPWLVALGVALAILAAPADASTWSRTLSWRDSTIRLVSACGPLDEAEALAELETGRARAIADLGRDDLPPLGTASDPYEWRGTTESVQESAAQCGKIQP